MMSTSWTCSRWSTGHPQQLSPWLCFGPFSLLAFFFCLFVLFVCLFVCLNIYESSNFFPFPRLGYPEPGCCQGQLSVSVSKVLVIQRPGIPSYRAGQVRSDPTTRCTVQVSNTGPLLQESDALPTELPGLQMVPPFPRSLGGLVYIGKSLVYGTKKKSHTSHDIQVQHDLNTMGKLIFNYGRYRPNSGATSFRHGR